MAADTEAGRSTNVNLAIRAFRQHLFIQLKSLLCTTDLLGQDKGSPENNSSRRRAAWKSLGKGVLGED